VQGGRFLKRLRFHTTDGWGGVGGGVWGGGVLVGVGWLGGGVFLEAKGILVLITNRLKSKRNMKWPNWNRKV